MMRERGAVIGPSLPPMSPGTVPVHVRMAHLTGTVDIAVLGENRLSAVVPTQRDVTLHSRVVAGEEDALGEVYQAFGGLVLAMANRVIGDRDAARDVAQEVFVQFWQRPLAYDPARGPLRSWLAMVAHRRAVDWVRREERRRRLPITAFEPLEHPPPDETVETADVHCRVRRSVQTLPETLRAAVELAFYRGLTYREIAVELGIPEGTAKSRMRSALQRLARSLADEGIGR